jgi:hypothetical protein
MCAGGKIPYPRRIWVCSPAVMFWLLSPAHKPMCASGKPPYPRRTHPHTAISPGDNNGQGPAHPGWDRPDLSPVHFVLMRRRCENYRRRIEEIFARDNFYHRHIWLCSPGVFLPSAHKILMRRR